MLFVKLKTFHNNNNNMARRMPAKWVNLTAVCVCLTVVLSSPANGFTPIGGVFQNGEGRKLFGGYRITPKYCRGTKTLPLSDPRSKGPTICMFNHECAQRNGEVVGACMDGFLFGACCQVPLSNANENTLIKDAQNPHHQSNSHSTESSDSALYGSNQKFESNEFQEIHSTSTKVTTESSYLSDLTSQKVQKVNKTSSSNNKIFYVNKGSVMVSSPSSLSVNDDYVMLSSSQSPFTGSNNNKVSFTTELPMKISTDLVDNEDLTQLPILLTETAQVKKNYSSGPLDLGLGEFTHSDITHPAAESVLIDNDLQFSTGYGGPQSVYVPPPAHAEIIPPKRRPAQRPSTHGPSKKPSNDQYVLIQTLEASKKPSQATGTTSTGISTNIDSIESIILMLNGTNHGPSYDVANTSPNYNQQKPSYGQNQGYGTTYRPGGPTFVPVTTVRPIVTVTTGSGVVLTDHISTTTPEPDTRRPTTSYQQESTEQTSNKYHSVEMSDEKPSFVEIPSPPHKQSSDKIDVGQPVGPPQNSYNVVSNQPDYGNSANSHKDASNPDYGYTSPGQPTSDFNKMPAMGEAYPVMDEETSAYFESSMLSEEQQSSQQTDEVSDKNIPAQSQYNEENKVQSQPIHQDQKVQASHHRPSSQIANQNYEQVVYNQQQQEYDQVAHNRPSSPTQNFQQAAHNRPSAQPSTQSYEQPSPTPDFLQNGPSSQRPPQNYEQLQGSYVSHSTASHVHVRPTAQVLTTSYEVQSPNRPGHPSKSPTTHIVRPTTQLVTHAYEVKDESPDSQDGYGQVRPTTQLVTQGYDAPQLSDYVSQSSDKETYQTPESQLIADLTNRIQNGYLSNSNPTVQILTQDQFNENYLSRPTPQSVNIQSGYEQSTAGSNTQTGNNGNYEKIPSQSRPTQVPNRITTLIVQSSSRPTIIRRPTKPANVNKVTYSDVETNYPSPTQSAEHSSISSTSRPVAESSSTARPSKRPTKRVTKRPSNQKKTTINKNQTPIYNQPPPQKFSGTPPSSQVSSQGTRKPSKKQPPSTSYVTGPTTARPEVGGSLAHNSPPPTGIANKVDTFVSSTQGPSYSSIYLSNPTDEIFVQNAPSGSNQQNYNKPLFVKIPSATQKPPSPTVIITPKPTVVNLITGTSSSKRPTTTPLPTFASSNSYIFSPLITRRPEYASSTQEYVAIPQVTSNDFDDPGYSGLHTLTTQNKIPTDDRPSFPGYYGPTPSYPNFQVPSDKYGDVVEDEEETYTSPNDFVNFPPVRNPNLNMSATSSSVTSDFELSTPAFVEDTILKDKMNTLVHKIVESLQGNFEALADMIDENNNTVLGFSETTPLATTVVTRRPSTKPPTRKPSTGTSRPTRVSTKKPPTRVSTSATTKRPAVTTRKPAVTTRRPTTKRPVTRKPTRKATTTSSPVQEDELIGEEEDNEIDSNIGEDNNESDRKFQCGVRPHVKSGRIVGGKGSTFGEFPWQVLVRESTWLGLFTKNKCGGVLITNKYVITAAHCQPGFLASLVAVMGEFDISGDLEAKRSVTKNVKRVIVHKQYDPATFENDLALLELESTVNYDTHIVPICMPADTADFTGRMATVTGWGRLKYGGGVPSVLQEVQVPIIENSVCQEMFHTAGHNKKILNSFLCAGYANGQKDSCEGDSGGPLVLQRSDGRYELAGTVSHGIKCAAPYLPGVYMRTTYYKPWLKSITGVK